jgi:hypothetical protein
MYKFSVTTYPGELTMGQYWKALTSWEFDHEQDGYKNWTVTGQNLPTLIWLLEAEPEVVEYERLDDQLTFDEAGESFALAELLDTMNRRLGDLIRNHKYTVVEAIRMVAQEHDLTLLYESSGTRNDYSDMYANPDGALIACWRRAPPDGEQGFASLTDEAVSAEWSDVGAAEAAVASKYF